MTTQQSTAVAAVSRQAAINDDSVQEIDLVELFFTLLHSWKALLMAFLVGAVIMGAYHTFLITPTYRATTELYITSTDSVISLQDLQLGKPQRKRASSRLEGKTSWISSSCGRCSRLTTGPSGTRSGGLRKGQSPCEFLGGLSEFLSR